MAELKATVCLQGKDIEVISSHIEFNRKTDNKGRPVTNVIGGRITITVDYVNIYITTKLPELVPAKYHLNLKNFSNSSEKSHLKHRNNFHSGSDSRKMANFTCTISKKPLRFTAERLH